MSKIKTSLGVIVIPKIEYSPYLCQLYSRLAKRINIFELKGLITRNLWRLILYRKRADVIHIHWLEYTYRYRIRQLLPILAFILPWSLIFCKYLLRYRIVVTLHNITPHKPVLLDRPVFKMALSLCDKIIVHNKFSLEESLRNYGSNIISKIVIIGHGNFISYYPNEVSRHEARKKLGLRSDNFVLLFFGLVAPYKGLDALVEAFKMALQEERKIILMIVGSASDMYGSLIKLECQKLDNCVFKGEHIPDDEVQFYLNAADIGVLPYTETTTPGSMFLFMSFKKPLIIPDLPPIREVGSDDFCIFFKPNDVDSLRKAILQAFSSKDKVRRMGNCAYSKALLYDWDGISVKTLNIYEALSGCVSQ